MAWDSPSTLALLGASAGFLDPRVGGPAAGFRGALQGMQAGNQIQQQRLANDELKNKLAKKMEIENMLKQLSAQHGGDMVGMSKSLTGSGYPELIKLGIDLAKAKTVRSYIKGEGPDGKPTYYAGYNTGELSPTGVTPSEKLMQINRGSQIDLANPYTGDAQKSLGVGISPGQSAQLAQSQNQFNMSHALAQQNSALNQYKTMMDYNPEFQAQKAGSIASAKVQATNTAQAQADYPKAINEGGKVIKQIDELLNHKGAKLMVGKSNPAGEFASIMPGTDAKDFKFRMGQLDGDKLIAGLPAMRGMGALTEAEGAAIKQSVSRMNAAQSEGEFVAAGNDLKRLIHQNMITAAQKAGKPIDSVPKPNFEYSGVFGNGQGNSGYKVERLD